MPTVTTHSNKFLVKKINFKGFLRIEKGEYPIAALREMLLNALVHRNYMGSPIQMRVYDNKLTIWNEGTLPEGLDADALKRTHSSRPRNLLIADACFKAGYIDAWSRGTLKIFSSCNEAGLPEPDIQSIDGGVLVTLYKERFGEEQLKKLGLSERQIKAVQFVKVNQKITNAEYQKSFDVSRRTATRDLQEMVEKGIFKYPKAKGAGAYYEF